MKILKTKNLALILVSSIALIGCSDDDNSSENPVIEPATILSEIEINNSNFFPEGIDYNDNNNSFFIGSIMLGEIGSVNAETGAYETFITREEDPNLISVTGIFTDETGNRLFAAAGNPGLAGIDETVGAIAYLGVYNLETAEIIQSIDLTTTFPEGPAFVANDIALDTNGDIYVTDSFSPVIYKVDGTTYEASVFVNGEDDFTPVAGGFGLNGIVYTNGNLIVCKTDDGTLIKIPLDAPEDYQVVAIDMLFAGADGLELNTDGDIVIINNGFAGEDTGAFVVSTEDDWATATVINNAALSATEFPTTATLAADGEIYAVNSYFSVLFDADETNNNQDTFSIVKVDL